MKYNNAKYTVINVSGMHTENPAVVMNKITQMRNAIAVLLLVVVVVLVTSMSRHKTT